MRRLVVLILSTVVLVGCEAMPAPSPSPPGSTSAAIPAATDEPPTASAPTPSPAATTPPAATPAPAATPTPAPPTPAPSAPAEVAAWAVRSVPEYTTAGGADLAVTGDGDSRYLHVVAANLEEAWVNGDDASVYLRTGDDGRSWGQRLLLGGYDPRVAAAGRTVYLAFEAYRCDEGVGFMRNGDHGRRAAWSAVTCLTRTSNVFGSPAIAATGRLVYVAASNDVTGRVGVRVSRDRGRTWTAIPLGTATNEYGPGGDVRVAATGTFAAVAWVDGGVTYGRVSVDGGRHWAEPVELADGRPMSASAGDGRLAFSGVVSTCGGVDPAGRAWGRTWVAGDLPATMPMPDEPRSCTQMWGGFLALGPGGSVGALSFAGADDCTMEWRTRPAGAGSWGTAEPLPGCIDEPFSVLWVDGGDTFVIAGGQEGDTDYEYALWVRSPGGDRGDD